MSPPDSNLRLARYFGLSEGFFLGLQMDYDLMQRRREIDRGLKISGHALRDQESHR